MALFLTSPSPALLKTATSEPVLSWAGRYNFFPSPSSADLGFWVCNLAEPGLQGAVCNFQLKGYILQSAVFKLVSYLSVLSLGGLWRHCRSVAMPKSSSPKFLSRPSRIWGGHVTSGGNITVMTMRTTRLRIMWQQWQLQILAMMTKMRITQCWHATLRHQPLLQGSSTTDLSCACETHSWNLWVVFVSGLIGKSSSPAVRK